MKDNKDEFINMLMTEFKSRLKDVKEVKYHRISYAFRGAYMHIAMQNMDGNSFRAAEKFMVSRTTIMKYLDMSVSKWRAKSLGIVRQKANEVILSKKVNDVVNEIHAEISKETSVYYPVLIKAFNRAISHVSLIENEGSITVASNEIGITRSSFSRFLGMGHKKWHKKYGWRV